MQSLIACTGSNGLKAAFVKGSGQCLCVRGKNGTNVYHCHHHAMRNGPDQCIEQSGLNLVASGYHYTRSNASGSGQTKLS
jgi:hypothetical protein